MAAAESNVPATNQVVVESNDTEDDGITLMDLFRIVHKHLLVGIITFVVVFAAVCAYTFLAPPKYSATAQVFATYSDSSVQDNNISNINSASTYITNQIQSYPTLATTESVLKPVIDDLGLDTTVANLAGQLTVTNPTNTAFVSITAETGDAKQASDIANSVAESLSNVVEKSLYASGKESPVKLSVVQRAAEPISPSSPKVALYLAVGLVAGLILGVFATLIRDLMATRVEEASDLQDIINAPIMGRIPTDESLQSNKPIIVSNPAGRIAEEFRRIRTNLSFISKVEGSDARMIVISSVGPSEGKTTVSVNVAAALAENGAKVLLIDADLRHPSVAERLSLEGGAGLTHVLSGQATVKDVVQRYWKPNLHILPAGPKPPNASMLLNSKTMTELLDAALQTYDYVIVDTSPMVVANDATVFGSKSDGIVLVSGRDVTMKRDLKDIAVQLDNLNVPVVGFVFNFEKERKSSTNGNYYYYYYYDEDGKKSKHAHKNSRKKSKHN